MKPAEHWITCWKSFTCRETGRCKNPRWMVPTLFAACCSRGRPRSNQHRQESGSSLAGVVAETVREARRRTRRAEMHRKADANARNLTGTGTLGSLHRIHVDAARAAFKRSRGHNVALAMPAHGHASSNINPAFRLRLVDHGYGPNESGRLTQTWRRRRQLSKEQRDGWSSRSSDELLPMTQLRP